MVQDSIIRWPLISLVQCFPPDLVEFDYQILFYFHTQGIRVVYNLLKPAGNRVVSLKVLCHKCCIPSYSPLEKNKEYSILLDDWLIRGGGGYNMFKGDNVIEHVKLSKFIFEKENVYDHPQGFIYIGKVDKTDIKWRFFSRSHFHIFIHESREKAKAGMNTVKVSKGAKIRNRYNQAPHLTKDTNGKVTTHSRHHKREPRGQPFPSR